MVHLALRKARYLAKVGLIYNMITLHVGSNQFSDIGAVHVCGSDCADVAVIHPLWCEPPTYYGHPRRRAWWAQHIPRTHGQTLHHDVLLHGVDVLVS